MKKVNKKKISNCLHLHWLDKLGWMQTKPIIIMVSFVVEIKFKSNYGIYQPRLPELYIFGYRTEAITWWIPRWTVKFFFCTYVYRSSFFSVPNFPHFIIILFIQFSGPFLYKKKNVTLQHMALQTFTQQKVWKELPSFHL